MGGRGAIDKNEQTSLRILLKTRDVFLLADAHTGTKILCVSRFDIFFHLKQSS